MAYIYIFVQFHYSNPEEDLHAEMDETYGNKNFYSSNGLYSNVYSALRPQKVYATLVNGLFEHPDKL